MCRSGDAEEDLKDFTPSEKVPPCLTCVVECSLYKYSNNPSSNVYISQSDYTYIYIIKLYQFHPSNSKLKLARHLHRVIAFHVFHAFHVVEVAQKQERGEEQELQFREALESSGGKGCNPRSILENEASIRGIKKMTHNWMGRKAGRVGGQEIE